jgi:hypothetical protein
MDSVVVVAALTEVLGAPLFILVVRNVPNTRNTMKIITTAATTLRRVLDARRGDDIV